MNIDIKENPLISYVFIFIEVELNTMKLISL